MNKKSTLIVISMFAMILSVFGPLVPSASAALPGGASFRKGYFDGKSIGNNEIDSVFDRKCGDVFDSTMKNKAAFIARVMSYYNPTGVCHSVRNALGAKFIMQAMMGTRSTTWTTANVTSWQNYVNGSGITVDFIYNAPFDYNSGCYSNSGCGSGVGLDSYFINDSSLSPHDALVFFSGGSTIFSIKTNCGNIIGGVAIPQLNWEANPAVTISAHTAVAGTPIRWNYSVNISGSEPTNAIVNYGHTNVSGTSVPVSSLPSGSPVGSVRTYTYTYTILPTDVGRTICSRSYATPHSKTDGTTTWSNNECVTVTNPTTVTSSACRPMKFTVEPRTYIGGSHTSPTGVRYTWPTITVPINVSTSVSNFGSPYSAKTTIDATRNHTTGQVYTVNISETTNRHSGWVDEYNRRGSEIFDYGPRSYSPARYSQGSEILKATIVPYYIAGVRYTRIVYSSYSPKQYERGPEIYDRSARSYSPKQYNWLYSGTVRTYTSATSWSTSIGPCFDYVLSASMGNSFGLKVEADSPVDINPTVSSDSWTRINYPSFWNIYQTRSPSKNTNWQISRMIIPPNVVVPTAKSGGVSTLTPCRYYDSTSQFGCTSQTSGSTTFNTSGSPSSSIGLRYTVPDSPAGTKICFVFSVYPNQSDPLNESASWSGSDRWTHAPFDPVNHCMIIVKKPKIQILGGDLVTGGGVNTSTSIKNISGVSRTFGSWVEYGLVPNLTASGIGSGSAFAYPSGVTNVSSVCSYSKLTFVNAPGGSCAANSTLGNFSSANTLPKIEDVFPASATNNVFSGGSLSGLVSGLYKTNGNITISDSSIGVGKWVVINASGYTVTIDDNIKYTTSTLNSIGDIPQVVIIANRIIINNQVTNVDSWLVAKGASGTIETCDVIGDTINKCNARLTVNGPVIANRVYLRRTGGSGTGIASADPAEVFNLRADAYIWVYYHGALNGQAQTTYATETTPRL